MPSPRKRVVIPRRIHSASRSRSRTSSPGTPGDTEVGVGVSQVITNNLKRSGLFAPIRSGRVHRAHHQHRHRAAMAELEADQRAGCW
jgi:hypothetical protein